MTPTNDTTASEPKRHAALEYPVCRSCGSENVVCDAWAAWNRQTQRWELQASFNPCHFHDCDHECKIDWKIVEETETERTRRLNDEMRALIPIGGAEAYGMIVMTRAVSDRGEDFVRQAARTVVAFDTFTEDNDPHGEHDFGSFEIDGETLFWKIDCYDRTLTMHSPDKSDKHLMRRVLTILLASEY